jgi:uncharacterized protein (TIGR02231 family)
VNEIKTFRGLTLAAFLTAAIVSFAAPASAGDAAVKSVNFYPSGARFTYEVESGGEFEFDIPGAFDENSVRCLSLERLASLKVERAAVKETTPEGLLPYERSVDEASKAVSLLEGRKTSLARTIEFLSSPFSGAPFNKEAGFDGDGLINYAKNAYHMRLELEAELVDVNMGIEKAAKVLEEARREYNDVKARLDRKKGAVPGMAITVRGTTDGPSKLTFEALTGMAGWNVVYEMNLDSAKGAVGAKMNAVVWQHTGTDIEGEFSFNTRQPAFSVNAPEVRPLAVGLRRNEMAYEQSVNDYKEIAMPGAAFSLKTATPAPSQMPNAIASLSNVLVTGSGKIEGDGSHVRVKLGEFVLECAPLLISIPEQNRESWIVASIDVIPESFLPGVAELSVDNASTGRANIAESIASARIPFGMAARITAKKTPYIRETGSSWTGTGLLNDGYTLEITNGMETAREVTVIDRIPFPTVDKVTIEVKKTDPKPDERDKENKLTWKVNLAPGETKKITVEYTIKYPGDETLEYW